MRPIEESIKMLIAPDSTNGQKMSGAMGIVRYIKMVYKDMPSIPDEDWILKQVWGDHTEIAEIMLRWKNYQKDCIKYFDAMNTLSGPRRKQADRVAAATVIQAVIYRRTGEILDRRWIMRQDWHYDPDQDMGIAIAMILDDYARDQYIVPEKERYIVMIQESNSLREGIQRFVDTMQESVDQANAMLDEALIWIRDSIHGKDGPGVDEIRDYIMEAVADKQARKD